MKKSNLPPEPSKVWAQRAIRITSDDPIICYGLVNYKYNSDGYMVLPVHTLGKSYQVASYNDPGNNSGQWLPSYTSIVGVHDNTKVNFKLGGNSYTHIMNDGAELKSGETMIKTLNKGDVWLIAGLGIKSDLTGSSIQATKPVAVISGNYCANIPSDSATCDYIIEQDIPDNLWGNNYLVAPITGRTTYPIIRAFAKYPNTVIYRDGEPLDTILTAGGEINVGFVEKRSGVNFTPWEPPYPIVISSDSGKPINVVLYNTGSEEENNSSEPFQMNLAPLNQFQKEITFNIPGENNQATFSDNYVNIIYKSEKDKIPESMMYGELVNDQVEWEKLNSISEFPGQLFHYNPMSGDNYYVKTIKFQDEGTYTLKCDFPFTTQIHGGNIISSFGYSLSQSMIDQNTTDTVKPNIDVIQGSDDITMKIEDKTNPNTDESNLAGLSFVEMINTYSSNFRVINKSEFISGDPICMMDLQVIKPSENGYATVYVSDRRGNDTTLYFTYKAPVYKLPEILGNEIDFGILKPGQKSTKEISIYNSFDDPTYAIQSIEFENNTSEFKVINQPSTPIVLNKNENYIFKVEFNATDVDKIYNSKIGLKINDEIVWYDHYVKAEVASPIINMNDINFGEIIINQETPSKEINIINSGKTDLVINSYTFINPDEVFNLDMPIVDEQNPLIIKAASTYKRLITCKSTKEGEFAALLVIESDGKIIKNNSNINAKITTTSIDDEELSKTVNIINHNSKLRFKSSKLTQLRNMKSIVLMELY